MDVKTAIDVLKKSYPKTTKMVNGRLEGGYDNLEGELGQALTLAIKTLDRNVPEKVKVEVYNARDMRGHFVWKRIYVKCPECESIVGHEHDLESFDDEDCYKRPFCYHCGQALDWSEINNGN